MGVIHHGRLGCRRPGGRRWGLGRLAALGLWGAFVSLSAGALAGTGAPTAEPLRVLVSSAWAMPLLELRDERVQGGIVADLAQAVAQRLGVGVAFVLMPRARMDAAALAGDVDLRCYVRPAWSSAPEDYTWGPELFSVANVVVGHAGVPEAHALGELPARSVIGGTRAFRYPPLEAGFQAGTWIREDASDQEKLLLKLSLRRHPYAVTDALTLGWFLRQSPGAALAPWRLVVSQEPVHCAVPKAGRVEAARLLAAVEAVRRSGELAAILQRYR